MAWVIRAIDLCCGAGGWACAARGLPIHIEMAIDLWPVACETYRLNHPNTEVIAGDVRDPKVAREIMGMWACADLVLGAIPCEWLSEYRKLKPPSPEELERERATLDAVIGIVKEIGPRWWCLEDVTALIGQLPIVTPYQIINSRSFSCQRRKRVFVGVFPSPTPNGAASLMLGAKLRPGPYRIGPRAKNREPVFRKSFSHHQSLAAVPDRKSPTIVNISSRRDAEMVVVDTTIAGTKRQMEWQEAAAIQGFPQDYVFYGSPGSVAKQVGQAVQIDTARAILEGIVHEAAREPGEEG